MPFKYFYPRSPCGERQGHRRCSFCPSNISIHALLAESDRGWGLSPPACTAFLSTLSLRRATLNLYTLCSPRSISIHALLAESDKRNQGKRGQIQAISIHALLAESDNNAIRKRQIVPIISIHALLAESDAPWLARLASCSHFYPRSPCGERLVYTLIFANPMLFLSTLSLRRATPVRDVIQWEGIFLSTLSLRRATLTATAAEIDSVISIHALLAESDQYLTFPYNRI